MNFPVVKTPALSRGVWVIKSPKKQIVCECIIMAFSRILNCVHSFCLYFTQAAEGHWQVIINV